MKKGSMLNIQYVIDYIRIQLIIESDTFLVQLYVLVDFDTTVTNACCGSEFSWVQISDPFHKLFFIPYTIYEKEQKHKYRNAPALLINWYDNEKVLSSWSPERMFLL